MPVMPFGINENNVTKIISTNYIVAPGISNQPSTSTSTYKSYNVYGYPTLVNEYGVDRVFEYK